MKLRITNYGWYVAAIFLVLVGVMQGCNFFENCVSCDEDEYIECFAPNNFRISEFPIENGNIMATLDWETQDDMDSYTILYNNDEFAVDTIPPVNVPLENNIHHFDVYSNCAEGASESAVITLDASEDLLSPDCLPPTNLQVDYDVETNELIVSWDEVGASGQYYVDLVSLNVEQGISLSENTPGNSISFTIPELTEDIPFIEFEVSVLQECLNGAVSPIVFLLFSIRPDPEIITIIHDPFKRLRQLRCSKSTYDSLKTVCKLPPSLYQKVKCNGTIYNLTHWQQCHCCNGLPKVPCSH